MNRLVSLLVFISLTSFTYSFAGGTGQGASVRTVVIDPGHGGMDPGAIGPGGHHEADLALAVSLKFGEMIKQAFPNVKIIYTRTTDKFVSLADRADMANKAKADLFICIHLNSAINHEAYGTSTYVLGLHRTDDNLEVAKRENAVIELEGDKDRNYEFDPNSPEGHIIMSMKQNAFLDQSILIASKIEDELAMLSKRKSRGVKQAGFWVLYKTAMPSLLAEIGFISNPSEEQYLATDQGQANIATSIFKAFRGYKYNIEGIKDTNAMANQPTSEKKTEAVAITPVAQATSPQKVTPKAPEPQKQAPQIIETPKEVNQSSSLPKKQENMWQPDSAVVVAHEEKHPDPVKPAAEESFKPINQVATAIIDTPSIVQNGKVQIRPEVAAPKTEKKLVALKDANAESAMNEPDTMDMPAAKPVVNKPKAVTGIGTVTTGAASAPTTTKPKETASITPVAKPQPKPVKPKEAVKPVEPAAVATTVAPTASDGSETVYFTVQLMAAKGRQKNYDDLVNTFGLIDREDIGNGIVRYMAGEYGSFSEAKKAMELAHQKGIKDAFIVAYLNKKRQDGKTTFQLGGKHP